MCRRPSSACRTNSHEQRRVGALLNAELAGYRADRLAGTAETVDTRTPGHAAVNADANGLKALALALVTRPGYLAVLSSAGRPAQVVVACAADVSVSAKDLLAALVSKLRRQRRRQARPGAGWRLRRRSRSHPRRSAPSGQRLVKSARRTTMASIARSTMPGGVPKLLAIIAKAMRSPSAVRR